MSGGNGERGIGHCRGGDNNEAELVNSHVTQAVHTAARYSLKETPHQVCQSKYDSLRSTASAM